MRENISAREPDHALMWRKPVNARATVDLPPPFRRPRNRFARVDAEFDLFKRLDPRLKAVQNGTAQIKGHT